jgi:hypothetical protein
MAESETSPIHGKVITMDAIVQSNGSHLAPLTVIEAQLKPIEAPSSPLVRSVQAIPGREPHAFPESSTLRALPSTIRDEMLEFYALFFCQGGFRQLGMTFEQFLLVAAAIKPADFPAAREESADPSNTPYSPPQKSSARTRFWRRKRNSVVD